MKRRLYVIVPIVVLLSLVGWRLLQKTSEQAAQMEQRSARMQAPPNVSVAEAVVRDVVRSFEATGNVEAPLNVKIASKITGRIEHLTVREGDRIRKGQVLVRIDPSEVEAAVQQQKAAVSEAQYRLAQAQLNRDPTNVSISSQIRQQEAAVASATADFNQVKENYEAQCAAAEANLLDQESRVRNAEAALAAAKANLENAETKYNRILELYNQGFTAAQDVDDAKAAVRVQQSAVEVAEGQLRSARAQMDAARQQANIVKTKGKADIEAARAKMTQAQAALEFARANAVQKPAYEQSLAALRAGVAAAKASLRSAEAKRADTVLRSPLDGFVTGRHADPGAVATPGQPILSVQFMDQIWVTISVPEEIIPKIHIGQPAEVRLDAFPKRVFRASVIQINPSADPQSRQFMVRVILSNKEGLLKPGMFARVSIGTDRVRQAVVVPREAVRKDSEGTHVMVVGKGGVVKRQPVITGVEDSVGIAIEQGVKPGDRVVTMSAGPLRDGQPVSIGSRGKRSKGRP